MSMETNKRIIKITGIDLKLVGYKFIFKLWFDSLDFMGSETLVWRGQSLEFEDSSALFHLVKDLKMEYLLYLKDKIFILHANNIDFYLEDPFDGVKSPLFYKTKTEGDSHVK